MRRQGAFGALAGTPSGRHSMLREVTQRRAKQFIVNDQRVIIIGRASCGRARLRAIEARCQRTGARGKADSHIRSNHGANERVGDEQSA